MFINAQKGEKNMNKIHFSEFELSKMAFQLGYRQVYFNEFGPKSDIATPDKWSVDSCVVGDFVSDYGFVREEADEGDIFAFENQEAQETFLVEHGKVVQKALTLKVNDLLEEVLGVK